MGSCQKHDAFGGTLAFLGSMDRFVLGRFGTTSKDVQERNVARLKQERFMPPGTYLEELEFLYYTLSNR